MLSQLSRPERRRLPAAADVGYGLAVISDDPSLADRAIRALERDGLMVTLVGAGPELSLVHGVDHPPTLVVVSADFGEHQLEQTLHAIGRNAPHALVLVVVPPSQHVDPGSLVAMGAGGIVDERDVDAALGPMCRLAATGHVSVPAAMRATIHPPALSHREKQTLGLALAGLTNAQIARKVYIAESTVKTHLSSAFRRLGVHSRREAAALLNADGALRASVLASLRLAREFPPSGGDA